MRENAQGIKQTYGAIGGVFDLSIHKQTELRASALSGGINRNRACERSAAHICTLRCIESGHGVRTRSGLPVVHTETYTPLRAVIKFFCIILLKLK